MAERVETWLLLNILENGSEYGQEIRIVKMCRWC